MSIETELKEYFELEDLKGYDCYEFLKDLSRLIEKKTIAELLETHGGGCLYFPNLEKIKNVKIRFTHDNKNISNRILGKKLQVTSHTIKEYKNVKKIN